MKDNMTRDALSPYEMAWEKGFAALKHFKAREGHCRVPRGHEEGRFKLGTWVVNQRNRRDALSVERRRRLDAIKFLWALNRTSWETGFVALKEFKAREKHCRVPRVYEEGGFKLDTWVVNQRNRRGALSVERRRKLDSIGFVWRLK